MKFISVLIFIIGFVFSSQAVTWTIGATGTYASISAAWAAMPNPIAAPYILEIKSDYVLESLPITLTAVNGASATNTITIRPETGVSGVAFTGTTETNVFHFSGADYVIIDGRPGGSGTGEITIENSSTDSGDHCVTFSGDATYNTIQYCNIYGSNSSTISGVVEFTTASSGGNDNNTIDNCVFDESGTNKPACFIYSSGSASNLNSGNTISNNEFAEFSKYGVNITSSNNDTWTIIGNSFYQDASFTLTSNMFVIYIDDGGGHVVTGNYIGGQAASCGGTAFTLSSSAYYMIGIHFGTNVDGTSNTISSNTIQNIDIAGTATYVFHAISTHGSADYVIGSSGNGNVIGKTTGTGSISVTATTASPSTIFAGIYNWSTGTYSVAYNTIASITIDGSSTGSNYNHFIYAGSTAGVTTIDNNTFGSTVAQNLVVSTSGYNLEFVDGATNSNTTITNNTIQNLDYNGTTDVTLRGITVSGSGTNTVTGNTIGSTVANNIDITAATGFEGVMMFSGTHEVDNNTIQQVNMSNSSVSTQFSGIYMNSGTNTSMDSNTIKDITTNGTSSDAFTGIRHAGGSGTVSSNTIENVTCSGQFYGIEITTGGVTITIANNTIGSATNNNMTLSGNVSSYGMYFYIGNSTWNLSGNTVQEFNCTSTGSSSIFYGIYNTSGTLNSTNDSVKEIDMLTTSISAPSLAGIYISSSNSSQDILSATISGLNHNTSGATDVDLSAIMIDDGDGSIKKCFIQDGSTDATGSGGWIMGIYMTSGNWDVWNNVILWDNNGSGTAPVLRGIMAYSPGTTTFYHNTVYVYGTQSSGTGTAAAFTWNDGTGTSTIKNNIFVANRASASQYAFRGITMGTLTVDENYLESADVLGRWNSVDKTTIADWRTASGASAGEESQAAGSITIDASGYVSAGYATYIEDAGADLSATVTDDRAGTARDASPWKGAFESLSALPVEWLSFDAFQKEESIVLQWKTASEENCDYYEIQKKNLETELFEPVGFVSGNGNTLELSVYEWVDENPQIGFNLYRLKQYDFDGVFDYSQIEAVNYHINKEISVFPNPIASGGFLNITGVEDEDVMIVNQLGQVLQVYSLIDQHQLPISDQWTPGIYFAVTSRSNRSVRFIIE